MVVLSFTLEQLTELISSQVTLALQSFSEKSSNSKKEEEYYTRQETASKLRVTLPTLHTYSLAGKIKAYRFGSRVRYKKSEIDSSLKGFI